MNKIILPIKPEYVKEILNGNKKYEYRKILPKQKIDTIIIYETSPVKLVVGEVKVIKVLNDNKEIIYKKTNKKGYISKEDYDKYFINKDKAVAYKLGVVTKYKTPKTLQEYNIFYNLQSYKYIK